MAPQNTMVELEAWISFEEIAGSANVPVEMADEGAAGKAANVNEPLTGDGGSAR